MISVRAETPGEIVKLPNDLFLSAVRRHAQAAFAVYKHANDRYFAASATAQSLGLCNAPSRLARLLLECGQCFGRPEGAGLVIEGHAKISALAFGLEINRKTVERALVQLEERGIVVRLPGQGSLRISSVSALKARLPDDVL